MSRVWSHFELGEDDVYVCLSSPCWAACTYTAMILLCYTITLPNYASLALSRNQLQLDYYHGLLYVHNIRLTQRRPGLLNRHLCG